MFRNILPLRAESKIQGHSDCEETRGGPKILTMKIEARCVLSSVLVTLSAQLFVFDLTRKLTLLLYQYIDIFELVQRSVK